MNTRIEDIIVFSFIVAVTFFIFVGTYCLYQSVKDSDHYMKECLADGLKEYECVGMIYR